MNKLDPIVVLLTGLQMFFTLALFFAEWWFNSDAQFYQTIAATMSGIAGALLMKITGHGNQGGGPTSTDTTTTTQQHTESEPSAPSAPSALLK